MSTCITKISNEREAPQWAVTTKSTPIDVDSVADRLEDAITTSAVAKHWPTNPAFIICNLDRGNSPGYWLDAKPDALHGPLNIASMTMGDSFRWSGFQLSKTPIAKLKSLRISGEWYDVNCYAIGVAGQSVNHKTMARWDSKAETLYCKPIVTSSFRKGADWGGNGDNFTQGVGLTARRFRLACAIQFNLHYRWRAVVNGMPQRAVMLDGDAVAIREFFSDRDITQGSTRRAALRHWVRKHQRRVNCTESEAADAVTWVKKHLRGKTDFMWHGLAARLEVAPAQLQELNG